MQHRTPCLQDVRLPFAIGNCAISNCARRLRLGRPSSKRLHACGLVRDLADWADREQQMASEGLVCPSTVQTGALNRGHYCYDVCQR
jgi:hypothetical protein